MFCRVERLIQKTFHLNQTRKTHLTIEIFPLKRIWLEQPDSSMTNVLPRKYCQPKNHLHTTVANSRSLKSSRTLRTSYLFQANAWHVSKRAVSLSLVGISWTASLALGLPPLFGWGGIAPEPNGMWWVYRLSPILGINFGFHFFALEIWSGSQG